MVFELIRRKTGAAVPVRLVTARTANTASERIAHDWPSSMGEPRAVCRGKLATRGPSCGAGQTKA